MHGHLLSLIGSLFGEQVLQEVRLDCVDPLWKFVHALNSFPDLRHLILEGCILDLPIFEVTVVGLSSSLLLIGLMRGYGLESFLRSSLLGPLDTVLDLSELC
jgi:hypothetical protein